MAVLVAVSIPDVFSALTKQLGGNQLALGPICTRVLMRTGVNLRDPRPDQVRDTALVARVVAALKEMGYRI